MRIIFFITLWLLANAASGVEVPVDCNCVGAPGGPTELKCMIDQQAKQLQQADATSTDLRQQVQSLQSQVQTLQKNPTQSVISGLVAYYPFNGNANDESGNKNHGVVNGSILTTDRFGNSNKAYHFNGTSDYIAITNGSQFNLPTTMSISLWVNPEANQMPFAGLLDKSHCGGYKGWVIQQHDTNNNQFYFGCANGTTWDKEHWNKAKPIALGSNQWNHLVITKNNNKVSYYLDGMLVAIDVIPFSDLATNETLPLFIGTVNNCGRFFKGILDDIRVYSRAISASEVKNLYLEEQITITDQ